MQSQNQPKLAPPGQRVDLGGFELHALVSGEGSPTVILEPALGGYALQYAHIQPEVSTFARVMSYDRAGQGWSDPSPQPRTPSNLALELHALLEKLDLRPPYVLVGHSFGGMLSRVYAGFYPGEVGGMVLVDATHEDEYAPFKDMDQNIRQMGQTIRLLKFLSRLGLGKPLAKLSLGPEAKKLSPEDLSTYIAVNSQPKHQDTMLAEFSEHRHYFGTQTEVPPALGDLPLVVVTAGNSVSGQQKVGGSLTGDQMNELHQKLQQDLARLSTRGEQVVVPGASHLSILLQPDYAAQVVDAIQQVVEQVRRREGLSVSS